MYQAYLQRALTENTISIGSGFYFYDRWILRPGNRHSYNTLDCNPGTMGNRREFMDYHFFAEHGGNSRDTIRAVSCGKSVENGPHTSLEKRIKNRYRKYHYVILF